MLKENISGQSHQKATPIVRKIKDKMILLLKKLWFRLFPIDDDKAIRIAAKTFKPPIPATREFKVHETMPSNVHIYIVRTPNEPCWYVFAPWGDGMDGSMLRSSRIIVVSEKTGLIVYDGSANDEG